MEVLLVPQAFCFVFPNKNLWLVLRAQPGMSKVLDCDSTGRNTCEERLSEVQEE